MFPYHQEVTWLEEKVKSLGANVKFRDVTKNDKSAPCVRIRLETDRYIGELVVYDTGIGNRMIASVASGLFEIDDHDISLDSNSRAIYAEFFSRFEGSASQQH